MIPRAPSLFQIEEGAVASAQTMPASGELVGLRWIIQPSPIQPSPRQRLPAVLRRSSAVRAPTTTTSTSSKCHESAGRMFVGLEFLKRCFCCHKKLDADMDVFVYRGEQAFCSTECRSRNMAKEERREMEILVRKRRDAFHSRHAAPAKNEGSNRRHLRLQIVA